MLTAKVMLLGDMGVGKTSILYRLVHDRFDGQYKTTLGVEILSYDVPAEAAGEEPVRLILWDTDGDFGHRIFETVYVAGAAGAIIVSDLTRPPTIERMAETARAFEENFPGRPYCALVNKVDLASGEESLERARASAMPNVEFVSAKTGSGVATVIGTLAETIRRRGL